jgi:hypothetical protein
MESGRANHTIGLHSGIGEGEPAVQLLLATPFAPAAERLDNGILHGSV